MICTILPTALVLLGWLLILYSVTPCNTEKNEFRFMCVWICWNFPTVKAQMGHCHIFNVVSYSDATTFSSYYLYLYWMRLWVQCEELHNLCLLSCELLLEENGFLVSGHYQESYNCCKLALAKSRDLPGLHLVALGVTLTVFHYSVRFILSRVHLFVYLHGRYVPDKCCINEEPLFHGSIGLTEDKYLQTFINVNCMFSCF